MVTFKVATHLSRVRTVDITIRLTQVKQADEFKSCERVSRKHCCHEKQALQFFWCDCSFWRYSTKVHTDLIKLKIRTETYFKDHTRMFSCRANKTPGHVTYFNLLQMYKLQKENITWCTIWLAIFWKSFSSVVFLIFQFSCVLLN